MAPLPPDQYHIGIVCALHFELAAVRAMLDEEHGKIDEKDIRDHNAYFAGRMHKHCVVIACLPAGVNGTSAAATVAKDMLRTFPHLRFGILVGIGSGIPNIEDGIDLRLGDVVVSQPEGTHGGVVQCHKVEKATGTVWEQKGSINAPPQALLTALGMMQAEHELEDSQMSNYLAEMLKRWPKLNKSGYSFPGPDKDILYKVESVQSGQTPADSHPNFDALVVSRQPRPTMQPELHYGTIVSVDQDIKSTHDREALRSNFRALCVETEAAGLMNDFPCVVVRGISDYGDTYKNNIWQRYAASTAAALTRELLLHVSQFRVDTTTIQLTANVHTASEDDYQTLLTIPHVADAPYSSYENQRHRRCLDGTRVELLEEALQWATSDSDQYIYWLRGRAGTGKSTIAITIAQLLKKENVFPATFFFKRGSGDLARSRKVLTTIAFQLATSSPLLGKFVCKELRKDPDFATSAALFSQFEKLILHPLQEFRKVEPDYKALVVILDALDECDDLEDARLIIQLFGDNRVLGNLGLRILITSRPDIPILLGFQNIDHITYRELALHDVPRDIIDADIKRFILHEMKRVRGQRNLPDPWPSEDQIQTIVATANGLFIYAAAACRYVDGPWQISPVSRLEQVCRESRGKHKSTEALDAVYLVVLNNSLKGDFDVDEIQNSLKQLRLIMGCVVLSFDKLSTRATGSLLFLDASDNCATIQQALAPLQAVIDLPRDLDVSIQILHLSFRDFLVDTTRCSDPRFHVDPVWLNHTLANCCIDLMMRKLKRNICQLPSLGTSTSSVSEVTLSRYIPRELSYACRHWINHTQLGQERLSDNSTTHRFFEKHAIHWLEVMCLLGEVPEVVTLLVKLESMIKLSDAHIMYTQVRDMQRFIGTFHYLISEAPLQLYASGLMFSPTSSWLKSHFANELYGGFQLSNQVLADWTACINVFEPNTNQLKFVTFSPEGKKVIAVTAEGLLCAWDIRTGRIVYESRVLPSSQHGDRTRTQCNEFFIAQAEAEAETVKLWDLRTGQCLHVLEHPHVCLALALSKSEVASLADDSKIRIWNISTGSLLCTLAHKSNHDNGKLMLSLHGSRLAYFADSTLIVWDARTGSLCFTSFTISTIPQLERDVMLSPSGSQLAYSSDHGFVEVLDATSGERRPLLALDGKTVVFGHHIVFAPNEHFIAIASRISSWIELWNLATAQRERVYNGHREAITGMRFSHDGTRLVSSSQDGSFRIWHITSDDCIHVYNALSGPIRSAIFSPDNLMVASESGNSTIWLWDTEVRAEPHEQINCHTSSVYQLSPTSDRSFIVSRAVTDETWIWDWKTGHCHRRLNKDLASKMVCIPGSSLLALGQASGTILIYDVQSGKVESKLEKHSTPISTLAVSRDGQRIVSSDQRCLVYLWVREEGDYQFQSSIGPCRPYGPIEISPRGTQVALVAPNGQIWVCDTDTSTIRYCVCEESKKYALSRTLIAFSPDSLKIACATRHGGLIRSWDLNQERLLQTYELGTYGSDRGRGSKLLFSPDSSRLMAAVGDNKTLYVWDVKTAAVLLRCSLDIWNGNVDFAADSRSVVIGGSGGGELPIPSQPPTMLVDSIQPQMKLNIQNHWILLHGVRTLWLPPEYRPNVWITHEDAIIIGSEAGRVTIVRFPGLKPLNILDAATAQ